MLFPEPDSGKTLTSLLKSRKARAALIAYFGGIDKLPSSIMRAARIKPDKARDAPSAERSYQGTDPKKNKAHRKHGAWNISGRGAEAGALSIFPQDVGRTLLLLYSDPKDVVVDPFAGHNSRMELCVENGRHYIGCDLSAKFMEHNRKRAAELKEKFPKARIKLFHTDSRKQPVPDEVGDFTITSPPYYDVEYYGDEPEQLGKCPTYRKFLRGMFQVLKENFRTLKAGAFSVWCLNDFRRKGVFHSYHVDMVNLARLAGFVQWDIAITDFGRGFRDVFIGQTVEQKILPKRHEYNLVFRKPE